ncbi:MAG: alpha/beta fold hydrolase [Pirellulales bacterium]
MASGLQPPSPRTQPASPSQSLRFDSGLPFDYRPPWYLRSGHLQTILGPFAIPRADLPNTRVWKVPLLDGHGQTFLYETSPVDSAAVLDPTLGILMLHGLGGDHSSPYLTRIAEQLSTLGYRTIRIDLPGAGPAAVLSDRAAHAGCSGDVRHIMSWASQHLGIDHWKVAGFSLGGNITLKLLAEESQASSTSIDSAIVVAPPMDLAYCCSLIEKGVNQIYNKFFLKTLKRLARERCRHWPRWQDLSKTVSNRLPTIRAFDDAYTSKIGGFIDASDYYHQCSTLHRVQEITIPTAILMDEHDPIVPASLLERVQIPSSVSTCVSRFGGHIGYLYRSERSKMACWMDEWVVAQLTQSQC